MGEREGGGGGEGGEGGEEGRRTKGRWEEEEGGRGGLMGRGRVCGLGVRGGISKIKIGKITRVYTILTSHTHTAICQI